MNTHIFMYISFTRATERLDSEHFTLFHLGLVAALDDGHALATVDLPLADVVACEVADRLDGVCLAVELELVAFHRLLDCGANIADAYIDTSFLCMSISIPVS